MSIRIGDRLGRVLLHLIPHCSRATQLSLSQILPKFQQGGAKRSQEDGASGKPEGGARGSTIRVRDQSGSQKSAGNGSHPKDIQLSY